ncbi:MAG: hypothetical protein RLZZ230_794 [Candidatus Parcubacteria bacterium]|jgi:uncharacterized protein (UPF0335 family)
MSEVLHADIFFFIASIATVFFCLLISIALYHVIKILQSLRAIIERIEAGSEVVAQDVANVRAFIASGGIVTRAVQFIMGSRGRSKTKRRARTD